MRVRDAWKGTDFNLEAHLSPLAFVDIAAGSTSAHLWFETIINYMAIIINHNIMQFYDNLYHHMNHESWTSMPE